MLCGSTSDTSHVPSPKLEGYVWLMGGCPQIFPVLMAVWESLVIYEKHSLGDGNIVLFGLRLTDALFDLSSVVELMVPLTPLSTTSKL